MPDMRTKLLVKMYPIILATTFSWESGERESGVEGESLAGIHVVKGNLGYNYVNNSPHLAPQPLYEK